MGLTLEEQIELLRTTAILCRHAARSAPHGGSGWKKASNRWDAVRYRLEAEHADELQRQARTPPRCDKPGCGEGAGCWICDPHPGHAKPPPPPLTCEHAVDRSKYICLQCDQHDH